MTSPFFSSYRLYLCIILVCPLCIPLFQFFPASRYFSIHLLDHLFFVQNQQYVTLYGFKKYLNAKIFHQTKLAVRLRPPLSCYDFHLKIAQTNLLIIIFVLKICIYINSRLNKVESKVKKHSFHMTIVLIK